MSRIKPAATTVVIKSTEEADTVLARIAAHKRRIELIDLSAADSRVKVLMVCTNEELMIARDTLALVTAK